MYCSPHSNPEAAVRVEVEATQVKQHGLHHQQSCRLCCYANMPRGYSRREVGMIACCARRVR